MSKRSYTGDGDVRITHEFDDGTSTDVTFHSGSSKVDIDDHHPDGSTESFGGHITFWGTYSRDERK